VWIEVPVLAIMARSAFLPPNGEQVYRSIAPNLEYQVWDGVSHFLMMERPSQFNEALTEFVVKTGLFKK